MLNSILIIAPLVTKQGDQRGGISSLYTIFRRAVDSWYVDYRLLLLSLHVLLGNTCLLVMCHGLQAHFAACTEAAGGFILQQFGQSEPPSLDHAFSVVKLVLQVCMSPLLSSDDINDDVISDSGGITA